MPPDKGRILCVEPVSDICEMVCLLLRAQGYESDSAPSIEKAIRLAAGGLYSLYILDDRYSDGTNADLAARLRAVTPAVPMITRALRGAA